MSASRSEAIKARAAQRQNEVSDPKVSAWVSAHAGSGKTHLLVNRIIRLMLAGAAPERILCLTYTRAAAAEMKQRLFKTLSGWITLDDEALRHAIRAMTNGEIRLQGDELARARSLFARALETPGGLKAQTIHAFCERLLQAFPVEAGMTPGFEVLDEAASATLLAEARARVLSGMSAQDDASRRKMADDLAIITAHVSEQGFDELLTRVIGHRLLLRRLAQEPQRRAFLFSRLRKLLGLSEEQDPSTIMEEWFASLDRDFLRRAAKILQASDKTTNRDQGARLQRMLEAARPLEAHEAAREFFLKKDGDPKSDAKLLTRLLARDNPQLARDLFDARDEFVLFMDYLKSARLYQANKALLNIGLAVIGEYDRAKARAGLCDYDDLIDATLRLLSDDNISAAWVRYRLDGGLDHVLVDEAQDTAPEQWEIIAALTEEFHAGEGIEHLMERTIFAVGDYKQSIYSFQGAQPDSFIIMRDYFAHRAQEAGRIMRDLQMNTSFRSVPPVLRAVDMVFGSGDVDFGQQQGKMPPHEPVRSGDGGLVELWPLEEPPHRPARKNPWQAPGKLDFIEKPRLRLARRIAATIRRWLDDGEILVSENRPIRPGDILILLRTRSDFMDAIIAALKQRNIKVAGADRLKVTGHIAVQDMMALGRFLLLPDDDLSLACVLKSPLCARDDGEPFDDDDLLALRTSSAPGRSLWRQLCDWPAASRAAQALREWRDMAGFVPPYELFAHILGRHGRRAAFISRLGQEAEEPLDAFLDLARAFEREHAPSLTGFLEYLEISEPEIKRDMEEGHGEVRVMTVHGAKGLQANVVFLPDTCSIPDARKLDYIIVPPSGEEGEETPLWTFNQSERSQTAQRMVDWTVQRNRQEYYRLLYVAMTRARDRLYIGGVGDPDKLKPESWYGRIASHLQRPEYAVKGPDGRVCCWRLQEPQRARPQDKAEIAKTPPPPLPAWAREMPRAEPAPGQWLAPSRLGREEEQETPPASAALSPLGAREEKRFRRGLMIHKLLQFLPAIAPGERRKTAIGWLSAPAQGFTAEEAEQLFAEAAAILDDPGLAPLFGPGSRAEAPFAARLTDASGAEFLVSGQIDRLVVGENEIIVADYKTSRPAPASIEDVPQEYIRQLSTYRLAMQSLWPGRPVRAVLIWTATPSWMEITPEDL